MDDEDKDIDFLDLLFVLFVLVVFFLSVVPAFLFPYGTQRSPFLIHIRPSNPRFLWPSGKRVALSTGPFLPIRFPFTKSKRRFISRRIAALFSRGLKVDDKEEETREEECDLCLPAVFFR